ncbi:MAG TPA: CHAD domain-containing protein [Ignavibacteriaceae bacterium]
MSKTKPWEISKLSIKQNLTPSAKIILRQRLESFLTSINLYLSEINPENLHQVRISLRRLRYPMEVFLKYFDRKKYWSFYKIVSSLQDLSGEVRDLDILKQNLNIYCNKDKSKTEEINFSKIDIKKEQFQSNLKLELMKFIHGKELKDFKKLINHHI